MAGNGYRNSRRRKNGSFCKTTCIFHFSMISDSNVQLEYTPFVFQVNPARGGESIAPSLGAGIDKSTFRLDYRRDFFYYNIAGPDSHIRGHWHKSR